jgi:hypothetical protein
VHGTVLNAFSIDPVRVLKTQHFRALNVKLVRRTRAMLQRSVA